MKKKPLTVSSYTSFGLENPKLDSYLSYEDSLTRASPEEPLTEVHAEDIIGHYS